MNKKNILITGLPGSGKTTLVENLCKPFKAKKGFLTKEVRESGSRTGFEIITYENERRLLAGISIHSPYRVSKYRVDVTGFEKAIENLFTFSGNDLLYIDEIGKMELFSQRFKELVMQYLNADNMCIATIAMKTDDPFIRDIKNRDDISLYTIDKNNRNDVFDHVSGLLFSSK